MTNEEAIRILHYDIEVCTEEQADACLVAIKALEQQPSLRDKLEKEYLVESLTEDLQKLYAENEELHKKLEQQPSEDCISREAVLEGLANIAKAKAKSDAQKSMMGRCMFFVEQLPSVTPERPKAKAGHWIYTPKRRMIDETDEGRVYITDYRCTCSECGGDFGFQKMSDAYCKYCGAKMEGKEDENNSGC